MDNPEKILNVELLKRENLTQLANIIQEHNKETKKSKREDFRSVESPGVKYKTAHDKYRKEHFKDCKQVCVQDLLVLIHLLSGTVEKCTTSELEGCIQRKNSNFQIVKHSPHAYLSALKLSLLNRNWDKMVSFAILLINFNTRYIQLVKNYCRIMIKFSPLVKELGLAEQLLMLTDPPNKASKIAIV